MTARQLYFYLFGETQKISGTPRQDAERILEEVCNVSVQRIFSHEYDAEISVTQRSKAEEILTAFKNTDTPLALIIGRSYFYNKYYHLSSATLIPRQDTESLVAACLDAEGTASRRVLELGTGSGIICQTLYEERPLWRIISLDISPHALFTAHKNCDVGLCLLASDGLSALRPLKSFDILISNPPYIRRADIQSLDSSVSEFEPHTALDGGEDGLDFYRIIATTAPEHMKKGGRLYLEIGWDQKQDVSNILSETGWQNVKCHTDLAGRDRVIIAHTP
ncbi:MAG: peptide chain release factor N(5)-glutamine methyltransferase [Fibrobacterota bacterium]